LLVFGVLRLGPSVSPKNLKNKRGVFTVNVRICLIISALLLALPAAVFANIFAAHLEVSATLYDPTGGDLEITYRLNEDATSVTIEIFAEGAPGTPVRTLTGGTVSGEQTVLWDGTDGSVQVPDGNYSFRVIAEDTVGHSAWEQINDTASDLQQHFFGPRGVAVQTDQTSPYFGTIYVCEAYPGATASGRTTSLGIYAVGSDGSDIFGQGDTGFNAPNAASIYRCALAEDSDLYIADWSDTTSGVWRAPGNLAGSWPAVLTEANRDSSGVCDNHGSVNSVMVLGTGASRELLTRDEDFSTGLEDPGSVLSYAIGNTTSYAGSPSVVVNDGGLTINSAAACFAQDSNGDWWLSQYRWTPSSGSPSLWRMNGTTGLVDYNSFDAGTLIGTAEAYGGICISPDGNTLYISGFGAAGISIFDIPTLAVTSVIDTQTMGIVDNNREPALDAAGNLVLTNSAMELLYVLSPPDGSNSFTSAYHTTFEVGQVTAIESPELYR
jgi:FlgD Ig-like domain